MYFLFISVHVDLEINLIDWLALKDSMPMWWASLLAALAISNPRTFTERCCMYHLWNASSNSTHRNFHLLSLINGTFPVYVWVNIKFYWITCTFIFLPLTVCFFTQCSSQTWITKTQDSNFLISSSYSLILRLTRFLYPLPIWLDPMVKAENLFLGL